MAADVSAVMDALHLQKVALAGWSDGAVGLMQRTQPNFSAADLAEISVPVAIVHSEHDEFIKREHAEYLAHTIPHAEFIYLPGVSHFAPLQRPQQFNSAMLVFLINTLA